MDSIRVRPLATLAIGVFGGSVVGLTSVGSGSLMIVFLMLLWTISGKLGRGALP